MNIRVWGTRGSLTTAGRETVRYGGFTTCLEVRLADGTVVVIDSGSGIHRLGNALLAEPAVSHLYLLLTHAHWDHLTGFPFFTPAYLERYRIHVRGGPDAKDVLRRYLEHQMDPPFFPVEFSVLRAGFDFDGIERPSLRIGSATVIPLPLSHPNGGSGFVLVEGGRKFAFLTDTELGRSHPGALHREDYLEAVRGADLLFHDAQYDDEEYRSRTAGWGHSTYRQATEFAIEAGVRRLGTFHHDPDHSDRQIDESIRLCRSIARERRARLAIFGVAEGMRLEV
jgi:phosphoribosyl 1,2-cyclic phosphodiesterase